MILELFVKNTKNDLLPSKHLFAKAFNINILRRTISNYRFFTSPLQ